MDREWMFADRVSNEYQNGVREFITFATENAKNPEKIPCPCIKCFNTIALGGSDLRDHLIVNGIDQLYTNWIYHGEKEQSSISKDAPLGSNNFQEDRFEEMAQVVEENFIRHPEIYDDLLRDARKPLNSSCTKFTRLSAVLRLYNLKAAHGWTDKSFTALLQLLQDLLPEDTVLPDSTYRAKRIICSLGLDYEKIHACPNDCVLYRNEYASLERCPNPSCGEPRYKRDRVPKKVVWYFPIIPRFRRLFADAENAKNLRWHAEEKIFDGKLRHPADSTQWVSIDNRFPDFGSDPRNLRLALSSDGVNPHGNQSTTHSTWPVVLVIYNLPPSLTMKRKYMTLSLLISGPKQPGNDIDVYLAPLMEDLKLLWDYGVDAYDAYRRENFCLRALLFCTINDFPAYGNLSGYTIKGTKACPICGEDTCSCRLKHGKKTVYLGNRRFLPLDHPYRRFKKAFNGSAELETAPRPLTGSQIFSKVKDLNLTFGKKRAEPIPTRGWKKKSVFFTLPYWEHLYVRHCLDVMHIEKNVCDSLIGTLMNVPGKTKDGIKARKDMKEMGIRLDLAPEKRGDKIYLPPACYNLSRAEKIKFLKFFQNIKVPYGFSSNVKSLVNMKEVRLQGMKSHDCHIIMQEFLPIAIRGILPKHVRNTITRLCFFFKKICSKVIDMEELSTLQSDIVVTLCQLEMYFPPSFFDIMVHLTVHLVREIRYCGPVYLRWMYPFERYMKVLKGYVKNRYRPEGCIVERYIVEEAVEFCSKYLSDLDAIGLPSTPIIDVTEGRGTVGAKVESMPVDMRHQAHLYVLRNSEEVQPYIEEHLSYLRRQRHTRKDDQSIMKEHNRSFSNWLSRRVMGELEKSTDSVSSTIRWLSKGPLLEATKFSAYEINGCTFYTKSHDDKTTMQNSGVTLIAQAMHVASAKDKNPISANLSYYGVIEDIWELNYVEFRVPVFNCKWVDIAKGIRVDELGFTLVDLNMVGHKNDSFILASQAIQVFYVPDPSNRKLSIVLSTKQRFMNEDDEGENMVENTSNIMPMNDTNVNEEEVYRRLDHTEALVFNLSRKTSKRKRDDM